MNIAGQKPAWAYDEDGDYDNYNDDDDGNYDDFDEFCISAS